MNHLPPILLRTRVGKEADAKDVILSTEIHSSHIFKILPKIILMSSEVQAQIKYV
jgi:hypothetical protein